MHIRAYDMCVVVHRNRTTTGPRAGQVPGVSTGQGAGLGTFDREPEPAPFSFRTYNRHPATPRRVTSVGPKRMKKRNFLLILDPGVKVECQPGGSWNISTTPVPCMLSAGVFGGYMRLRSVPSSGCTPGSAGCRGPLNMSLSGMAHCRTVP